MNSGILRVSLKGAILFLATLCFAPQTWAVPSFARQTGLACNACHTVAPQLNAFGRYFKLHGYVLGPDKLSGGTDQLSIDKFPPLSAMVIVSDTQTSKAQPDSAVAGAGAQNGTVAFPQQLSMFYAGAIAEHMGAFAQITYEQPADHFSMDNTDIRYARDANWGDHAAVWGVTINNNPTVQDVWNSTPAWGYPYISSGVAPGPAAAPLLAGALAQNAAGAGVYAWLDNTWYGEFTLYRSSPTGAAQPVDSTSSAVIANVAPYFRGAWEHAWAGTAGQNDLEIGLIGMSVHQYPGGGNALSGTTDDYRDTGVDTQYQYITGTDSFALHASYIHEQQDLNASGAVGASAASDHLNYWTANASYYWDGAYGPTLGYFNTTGSTDPLLYAPAPLNGSATGSPDSSGWIAQWTWLPSMNVQVTAQYTWYDKFNGASSNYDGSGRKASDNNTLYLALWLLW
ncbi:MAG TPA: cytochrome C [Gammaproteobacteria bacterium]|nr:cytochrome C [Gammaproteobacteria bacterium]